MKTLSAYGVLERSTLKAVLVRCHTELLRKQCRGFPRKHKYMHTYTRLDPRFGAHYFGSFQSWGKVCYWVRSYKLPCCWWLRYKEFAVEMIVIKRVTNEHFLFVSYCRLKTGRSCVNSMLVIKPGFKIRSRNAETTEQWVIFFRFYASISNLETVFLGELNISAALTRFVYSYFGY